MTNYPVVAKYIVPTLLVLLVTLSGLHITHVTHVVWLSAVMGLVSFYFYRPKKYMFSSWVKVFLGLLIVFSLYVMSNTLILGDWRDLFRTRYEVFIIFLVMPYIALLLEASDLKRETLAKIIVLSMLYTWYLIYLLYENNFPYRGGTALPRVIFQSNFAVLMALVSLVCLLVLDSWWRMVALVSCVGGFLLSALLATRSDLVILVSSLGLISIVIGVYRVKALLLGGGFIVFLAISIYASGATSVFENKIQDTVKYAALYLDEGDNTSSLGSRLALWGKGIEAWKKNVWFGQGFDQIDDYMDKYPLLTHTQEIHLHNRSFLHSDWVQSLAELGVVGFVLVLSIMAFPLYCFYKTLKLGISRKEKATIFVALVGLIITTSAIELMFFERFLSLKYSCHVFIVLVIILLSMSQKLFNSPNTKVDTV